MWVTASPFASLHPSVLPGIDRHQPASGRSGDDGGDDVAGVTVEVVVGPVVARVVLGSAWRAAIWTPSGPRIRLGDPPRLTLVPPGPLAHRVEQGTFNPKVQGSRPWRPTVCCVTSVDLDACSARRRRSITARSRPISGGVGHHPNTIRRASPERLQAHRLPTTSRRARRGRRARP